VELTNGVIVFRNFLIRLNSNVQPGQVIDVGLADRVDLSAFFKRRTRKGDAEINTRWDSDDTNIPRILNMMMFFRAVGGKGYTDLSHDYQSAIDLSSHLKLNRAILVGRAKIAATPLQIDGEPAGDRLDTQWTIVRILYPVKEVKR
jgi:hypothetical protein